MTALPYTLDADDPARAPLGLIVLQTDETIEPEVHASFSGDPRPLYVSRVASNAEVTHATLAQLEQDLPAAAALLPKARPFGVVGFGCTSASSVIGSDTVAALIQSQCDTQTVTDPLRAACAFADHHDVKRIAFLSPYIEEVSAALRAAFNGHGISTDVFGSFHEGNEARVVRISNRSIVEAACTLGAHTDVDGVFLSCTNLRTAQAVPEIAARLGKPVFSSNSCLAWHMKRLGGA